VTSWLHQPGTGCCGEPGVDSALLGDWPRDSAAAGTRRLGSTCGGAARRRLAEGVSRDGRFFRSECPANEGFFCGVPTRFGNFLTSCDGIAQPVPTAGSRKSAVGAQPGIAHQAEGPGPTPVVCDEGRRARLEPDHPDGTDRERVVRETREGDDEFLGHARQDAVRAPYTTASDSLHSETSSLHNAPVLVAEALLVSAALARMTWAT
jgi:hypothetical protein